MSPWRKKLQANRSVVLALTLFASILVHPALSFGSGGRLFVTIVATAVTLSAVYAATNRPRHVVWVLLIGLLSMVANWFSYGTDQSFWALSNDLLSAFLYGYVSALLLSYILVRKGPITVDKLAAAVSVYLFFGLLFSHLYHIVEALRPGSIVEIGAVDAITADLVIVDLNYFSFVTLTTLGYGDIVPVGPMARCLAMLEAALGVLYLAILISRLAALYRKQE